jgi:hypothetical protein
MTDGVDVIVDKAIAEAPVTEPVAAQAETVSVAVVADKKPLTSKPFTVLAKAEAVTEKLPKVGRILSCMEDPADAFRPAFEKKAKARALEPKASRATLPTPVPKEAPEEAPMTDVMGSIMYETPERGTDTQFPPVTGHKNNEEGNPPTNVNIKETRTMQFTQEQLTQIAAHLSTNQPPAQPTGVQPPAVPQQAAASVLTAPITAPTASMTIIKPNIVQSLESLDWKGYAEVSAKTAGIAVIGGGFGYLGYLGAKGAWSYFTKG